MQDRNSNREARIGRVRGFFAQYKIDSLIFFNMNNIRYLSGFTGSDGVLIISENRILLLVDGRYSTQAQLETSGVEIIEYKGKLDGIRNTVRELSLKSLGFESASINVLMYNQLICDFPVETLVPLGDELKLLRACKDEEEILLMAKAAEISSAAILALISHIKPGCSEKDLALQLEIIARQSGADQPAFETIVAFGENSALPHAKPSDRKIKSGDFIVIDFGVRYQGYCSDETCTFVFGELTDEQKNAYQAVKNAHDLAIDSIRAGVCTGDVDLCVRKVLGEKYSRFFSHGTGHGVGLEVHEAPRLAANCEDFLEENMVVTVEPGLYLPGRWGIRIEDTILVKKNSCEKLTKMDKGLIIIQ